MKWLVLLLFLAALAADIYIYRNAVCTRFRRLGARMGYIAFALITDGAAFAALMLYNFSALQTSTGIISVMWLVWLFFLTLFPKLLFVAGAVLDFLIGLLVRRRVMVFRVMAALLSVVVTVAMVWGATAGRTSLRVTEVEICSPRVPAGFDGYRVVQVSDLHVGTMIRPVKFIGRIADRIAGLDPDLVVNTGDLVNINHRELTPEIIEALSRITAPDGVRSVWGNHDLGFYIKDTVAIPVVENFRQLEARVREAGWIVLSDRSEYIRRGGDSIVVSGVDYPRTEPLNGNNAVLGGSDLDAAFSAIAGDPFNVVLSHTPQMWSRITDRGRGELTLSGHTHAMQMKFPLWGRVWSPAEHLYTEWSGKYGSEGGGKNNVLYVNDGIGCVGYPMRIGARPEITLFILKRCE